MRRSIGWKFGAVLLGWMALQAVGLTVMVGAGHLLAADEKPASGTEPAKPEAAKKDADSKEAPAKDTPAGTTGKPLQFQENEDPIQPLTPVKPRSAEEATRVTARAWYGTGRVLETKSDFQGALNAYKKAAELDPRSVVVYRQLMQLSFTLNQPDEAVKYALKAVELDPNDYELAQRLGVHFAQTGDVAAGVKYLEQALKAPTIPKFTGLYVTLNRQLAILYEAADRPEDASRAYEVVLDGVTHPEKYQLDFQTRGKLLGDATATYERMGQSFLNARKFDLALVAFQKAGETKRGKAGNHSYNLALTYLEMGEAEKALAELQPYFDEQRLSKGRDAYELLARILDKLGKKSELVSRLEAIAEDDSRNATLMYFLAEQYAADKQLEKAEGVYKKTLATAPDVQGYAGLAAVYRQLGKPEQLLEMLAKGVEEANSIDGVEKELKLIAKDDELTKSLLELGKTKMAEGNEALKFAPGYVLANLAADSKRTDAAVDLYRYLIAARKDRVGLLYRELGGFFIDVKKFPEAAKVFEEAASEPSLSDDRPDFLLHLAQALELGGDTKGALAAVATARQVIPDHPLMLFQEGWIYQHAQQYDEAIARFEKLISTFTQPNFRSVHRRAQFMLSSIYVQRGEVRKGEEILEQVLRESPNDPSVNNDLGYLYADQGKNLEQAEMMIRKAVKAEPENGAYLDSLGWVLFKLGKTEEAIVWLEKAVERSTIGGDDTLWDHLGDAYDKQGKAEKALAAWKRALESAKQASRPDQKLMKRLEEKIANQAKASGGLKPAP